MAQENSRGKDWRTILTLALSGLGIVYFLVQALALGGILLFSFIGDRTMLSQSISLSLLVWSSILTVVVLLPLFLLSLYRLRGLPLPTWLDLDRPMLQKWALRLIILWPLIVFVGWLVADRPAIAVFLLGPISLLVAGLPILWIYTLSQRKMDGGSQIQRWSIFGISLAVTPTLVMIVEILAVLFLAVLGGVWLAYRISISPQIERELQYIANQIMISGQDLDKMLQLLKPYIMQPSVIAWALVIFAGLMPMIEEILKPFAIWFMAGRRITPQEGFVSGLLCGAGFALLENILYFSMAFTAEDWLFMAIGRAGTGVLHMLASGLVGWGLAKAWQEGQWAKLGLNLAAAILFHGLWNALALLSGVAPLFLVDEELTFWQTLLFNLPTIILLMLAVMTMFWIRRHLQRQAGVKDQVSLNHTENLDEEILA